MAESDFTRAENYRSLARQMRDIAKRESNMGRRIELIRLADQYEAMAEKLSLDGMNG